MFVRASILCWFLLAAPGAAAQVMTYHEASCPSVDVARMPRVKRVVAQERGWIPAADCHPEARVRYLGVAPDFGAAIGRADAELQYVSGYTRKDGTVVDGYYRRAPALTQNVGGYTRSDGTAVDAAKTQHVSGYTRENGTHVDSYNRRPARRD